MSKSKRKTSRKSSDLGIILNTGEELWISTKDGEPVDEETAINCVTVIRIISGIIPGLPREEAVQMCYDQFMEPGNLDLEDLGRRLMSIGNDTMIRQ